MIFYIFPTNIGSKKNIQVKLTAIHCPGYLSQPLARHQAPTSSGQPHMYEFPKRV